MSGEDATFLAMTEAAREVGLGALAHRNFRLFFFGQGVSLIGTWMQSVAQGWLVLSLTNSPFYVGFVSALGSIGVLAFTLYAGVIADRTDKRRTVIITQSLSMLLAFVLAGLALTKVVTVWHVMVRGGRARHRQRVRHPHTAVSSRGDGREGGPDERDRAGIRRCSTRRGWWGRRSPAR